MASDGHKYKLIYFDIRARGEPVRMMMALTGEKYDEENPQTEDWPAMKDKTPLGFLPILETDEGTLSQSVAIWSFIATRLGFHPEGDFERAKSDSLMITANDLLGDVGGKVYIYNVYKFYPEPEDLQEKINAVKDIIKHRYDFFATQAKPGAKFLFGDQITVADIALYCVTDYCKVGFPETATINDWVKEWLANMDADEKFGSYIKNRKPSKIGT